MIHSDLQLHADALSPTLEPSNSEEDLLRSSPDGRPGEGAVVTHKKQPVRRTPKPESASESNFGVQPPKSEVVQTFATRFAEALGNHSIAEFSRLSQTPDSTLRSYLGGESLPSWETAIRIARAAGRSLDWFAGEDALPAELMAAAAALDSTGHFAREVRARYGDTGRIDRDQQFALLPLYDVRAAAGHGAWNDAERISKQLAFRRDWIGSTLQTSAEHLVLIYVDGDSMEPRFADGDVVMVDTSVNEVRTDGIFVFTLDDALLIKRLQRLAGGRLRVVSENPVYQPFEIPAAHLYTTDESPHHVVGRVVWGGIRL